MAFVGVKVCLLSTTVNPSAATWTSQVIADGGTVSGAQINRVSNFANTVQRANLSAWLDDCWLCGAENSYQTLRSLFLNRLATAVNTPTWIVNRAVQFNGTTNYINTNYAPATNAVHMTGSNIMAGVYELTNVASTRESLGVVDSAVSRIELISRTGGGAFYGAANSNPLSDGTNINSSGLVSIFRNGSSFGFYKNDAVGGTISPTSTGTVLPTNSIFIAAQNFGGVAASWRASTVGFAYVGAYGSLSDHTILWGAAYNYLYSLGAFSTYADPVSGNDSNQGTSASPWLTWDKLYSSTAAGGTAWAQGSSGTLQASTQVTIANPITVQGVTPKAVTLAGNSTGYTFIINPPSGQTVLFKDVTINPSLNTAGPAIAAFRFDIPSGDPYYFNMDNCYVTGWTGVSSGYGIYTSGVGGKNNINIQNCTFSSDTVVSAVGLTFQQAGYLVSTNNSITLTNQALQSYGGIIYGARAPGCYAKSINDYVNVSLLASLTTTLVHYGITFSNVSNSVIDGATVIMSGSGTVRQLIGLQIAYVAIYDTGGCVVDNNVIRNSNVTLTNCYGGGGIFMGGDSGDRTKSKNNLITNSSIVGDAGFQAGGGHGLFLGNVTTSIIENSTADIVGIGMIDKLSTGNILRNNTISRCTSSYILIKGSADSLVEGNTVTLSKGYVCNMLRVEDDPPSGIHSTNATIRNNTFIVESGTNAVFVVVDANNTATFSSNTYWLKSGSLSASPFQYQGVNYTPSQWRLQFEPNAIFIGI